MRFFQKTKGAISIFLALIMLPMFTYAGIVVDSARISAARTAVSGAGDLAMSAALSEYDTVLLDVYGLFAMSSTTEELEENVSRYFSNTINNTGILESSDSYTRSFINSIGSLFSNDDISFDNLLDTQVESFSLIEVADSALGNPTVLERQIVEYMKIRGPISLGKGILTKFGLLGETSKQTKAVEAKVDYEKKLETVEEACQTAYNAINAYNNAVKGSNYDKSDFASKINQDLKDAKNYLEDMLPYVLALEADGLSAKSISADRDAKNTVQDIIDEIESENKNLDAYNLVLGYIDTDTATEYGFGLGDTLNVQISAITSFNANASYYSKQYAYVDLLEKYYKKLTKEEKEERAEEYDKCLAVQARIDYLVNYGFPQLKTSWKNSANEKGASASEELYNWYKNLDNYITKLEDAQEALNAVLKNVGSLDSARNNWESSVSKLSDSEIKTSMEGDYKNSAKDLNKDAVNKLIDILKDNKTYFEKMKSALETVTLYNKKICVAEGVNYDTFKKNVPTVSADTIPWVSLDEKATQILNSEYKTITDIDATVTVTKFRIITGANDKQDEQFYKYLKNTVSTKTTTTTSKEDAEKTKSNMFSASSNASSSSTTADLSGLKTGSYTGATDTGLTAEIKTRLDNLAKGVSISNTETFTPQSASGSGSDDDMANAAQANLNLAAQIFDKIGNIAATARDTVYLEEYFTEMFSCYTSGKGPNGTTVPAMSLSNNDMSTSKFYRSEVEYLLWGNDDVAKNLNNTKALIFGIRFALNSIYAMTSSDTRTPALAAATAIAGWTGFGVPIVQTVILLAWSMAESLVDLDNLCKGEAVCIYKTKNTWVLGLNGVKQIAQEAASKAVGDIFDKIESAATDSISSLTGQIKTYVSDTTDSVVESVKGSIMTSVERLITQIVGESNYNLTEAQVQERVDQMITDLRSSVSGDGISQQATLAALDVFETFNFSYNGSTATGKAHLSSTVYSLYTKAKSGVTDTISTEVDKLLRNIATPIENKINETVSKVGAELETEVSKIISEGGDQVKAKLSGAIDKYMGKMNGGGGGNNTAMAAAFSLTYKEYLKGFTLMWLLGNEQAMLTRCAQLIQMNMAQTNTDFDITKAYTMIGANAKISIKTTFFDVPVASGVDASGNPVYTLDFGNIGDGRRSINYAGFLGY